MLTIPDNLTDIELHQLMLDGDSRAFSEIYRRHHPAIYRFALLMGGSVTIAEDVTQEVFMVLIREGDRYDFRRGTLTAFLYGIARNYVRRFQHRDRSYLQLTSEIDDENSPVLQLIAPDNPLGDCARRETIKLVRQAVLNLPARYREVVVLCDFQELSYAAAAEVLGCPVGTINSRLHRAHSLLLKKLSAAIKLEPADSDNSILRCFA